MSYTHNVCDFIKSFEVLYRYFENVELNWMEGPFDRTELHPQFQTLKEMMDGIISITIHLPY